MNSISQKLSVTVLLIMLFFLFSQSSCVISEYGDKTKEAIISGTSYVGEKTSSIYHSTKNKLGFKESKSAVIKPMSVS